MYITKDKFFEMYPVFSGTDETTINNRIAEAESLINSYLNDNVVVDVTEIPPILERIAADLTCYYLQSGNLQALGEESHSALYNNAVRLLKDIANGTIKLKAKQTTEETEETGSVVIISSAGSYEYRG